MFLLLALSVYLSVVLCVWTAGNGLCVSYGLRVCCCMFFVMLLFQGFAWMVMVYVCRSKSWDGTVRIKVHRHLLLVSLWCCFLEVLRGWWWFMYAVPKVEMEQCWLKFICTSACFFVMFCFRVFAWLVGVDVCRSKSWDGTVLSRSLVGEHKDSALHPSITSSSNNKQNNNKRKQ